VRSVGYSERVFPLTSATTTIQIALVGSAVSLPTAKVVGDITPEEIIKRAVERKEANAARITSIVSKLYSKMKVGIDMGSLDPNGSGAETSISETFSKVYDQRKPEAKKRVHILQRRQTANIGAQNNLAVFDDFFDFTQDEITLIKTTMVTPLGKDALDEYTYRLIGKKPFGDQMVYELAFEPKARVFPGFEGTLTIIEESYQVIGAKFSPTDETAFPFLKKLTYEQRYEKVNDSIWAPTYQNVTAGAKVRIIAVLMEITADVSAQTYVTDIVVNQPIDDTLLSPRVDTTSQTKTSVKQKGASVSVVQEGRSVTVDPQADSARSEFWEEHAFAESSNEEREIYRKQDSGEKSGGRKQTNPTNERQRGSSMLNIMQAGPLSVGVDPLIDRSSITSVVYGGTLNIGWSPILVAATAGFGSKNTTVGKVDVEVVAVDNQDLKLKVFGSVMSYLATVQESRTIVKRLNFLHFTNLLYTDYFDFFRTDGTELGVSAKAGVADVAVSASWMRHINMPVIENVDRPSVTADAGDYQMVQLSSTFFQPGILELFMGSSTPYTFHLNALTGRETRSNVSFWSVDAAVDLRIPTFTTGYVPMELDVTIHAGIQDTKTPVQGRFIVQRRFPILGAGKDFNTVGINNFAGTEFLSVMAEHNFSDMWWRIVGLPTFASGRGVDLIGRFGAINTTQRAAPFVSGQILDSTPGVYMEAGFAIARIPTFVSDLFFLRFDAMWPVGPLSPRGSFGWTLTLSSPLL